MRLLFLLGAGRSGTTLLYKMLSLHQQIGYISNYDQRLPQGVSAGFIQQWTKTHSRLKLASWFKKSGNAYDFERPLLRRVFPTPVEGEAVYESCGMPLIPGADEHLSESVQLRLQQRFKRLFDSSGCDLLVSKRTANNRRIRLLNQVFPQARYINLIRDGREVAYSLSRVNWWNDHVIWWQGETAAALEAKGMNRFYLAARNWVEEINAINDGLEHMPPQQYLTIRYEDLIGERSRATMQSIFDFLDLPMSDDYISIIDMLGLKSRPPSWKNKLTQADIDIILKQQADLLTHYGYLQAVSK